jgi:hypothetical protein
VQEVASLAAERFKVSIESWLANDGDLIERLGDRSLDPYLAATELTRRATRDDAAT